MGPPPSTTRPQRDYSRVRDLIDWTRIPGAPEAYTLAFRLGTAAYLIDLLWDAFSSEGLSWIGVYTKDSDADAMTLGPRRDKPACSPIGLHGICGKSWLVRQAVVVHDVGTLGANYIACDPRDRSELVVPLLNPDGTCWGVLDADSHEVGAFSYDDAVELTRLVESVGLSWPRGGKPPVCFQ